MASEMLTPSPRWLRTAAVLFLLAMLQACATMSASECRTASWRDVGLRDGLAGEPLGLLDRRTRACAEAGVAVNVPLYLEGRNQGLPDYCRLDNAARQGLAGKTYHGVCAPGIDAEFRRAVAMLLRGARGDHRAPREAVRAGRHQGLRRVA